MLKRLGLGTPLGWGCRGWGQPRGTPGPGLRGWGQPWDSPGLRRVGRCCALVALVTGEPWELSLCVWGPPCAGSGDSREVIPSEGPWGWGWPWGPCSASTLGWGHPSRPLSAGAGDSSGTPDCPVVEGGAVGLGTAAGQLWGLCLQRCRAGGHSWGPPQTHTTAMGVGLKDRSLWISCLRRGAGGQSYRLTPKKHAGDTNELWDRSMGVKGTLHPLCQRWTLLGVSLETPCAEGVRLDTALLVVGMAHLESGVTLPNGHRQGHPQDLLF